MVCGSIRIRGRRRTGTAAVVAVATLAAVATTLALGAGPAGAAVQPPQLPSGGTFVIDGDPAAGLSGRLTMPGGFPEFAAIESTSNGLAAAGDGASVFLNASTPVGQAFGSSVNQPLLTIGSAPDGGTSATSYRLGNGTPTSGWAFVLGDIDADQVKITGLTTQDGILVPAADLGFHPTAPRSGFRSLCRWPAERSATSSVAPAVTTSSAVTTTAPVTTSPSTSPPTTTAPVTTGELAATGSPAAELVPLAAALLMSGGAMLLVARRRPVRNSTGTRPPAGSSRRPHRPGPTNR